MSAPSSTGTGGVPAGSFGFPQAGPHKPLSLVTQNPRRERRLGAGLALNFTSDAAPHLLSEDAGALVSLPGQGPGRTHLPACGRRDPLTSAAPTPNCHRKRRSLLKKNKKKESKNRKNESKKTAFALVFLSTLQGFLFLTATTMFRPSSGGVTQSVPPFLPRTRWKSGALKASGRDLIGPFTRQQGDWPAPSRKAGRVVLSRDVVPES